MCSSLLQIGLLFNQLLCGENLLEGLWRKWDIRNYRRGQHTLKRGRDEPLPSVDLSSSTAAPFTPVLSSLSHSVRDKCEHVSKNSVLHLLSQIVFSLFLYVVTGFFLKLCNQGWLQTYRNFSAPGDACHAFYFQSLFSYQAYAFSTPQGLLVMLT